MDIVEYMQGGTRARQIVWNASTHMISRDRDHSEGRGVGVNRRLEPFRKFIRLQKALFKVPKIRNIIFWIENGPPPWNFSENSSDLVAPPFP